MRCLKNNSKDNTNNYLRILLVCLYRLYECDSLELRRILTNILVLRRVVGDLDWFLLGLQKVLLVVLGQVSLQGMKPY